jgi:hypothetical protein
MTTLEKIEDGNCALYGACSIHEAVFDLLRTSVSRSEMASERRCR